MSKSNKNTPPSARQKKKIIREGLRELKGKSGWDVDAFRSPSAEASLRELEQRFLGNQAFSSADDCAECGAIRQESGDQTALCDTHLGAAMGFGD